MRTQDLGEADRIITLLTQNHGLIRAVARSVRKTSSRLGARLEPFGAVDVQIRRGKADLHSVAQVEILAPYGRNICADYPLYTAANLMMETALRLTEDEPVTIQHYHLTLGALHALAYRRHHPTLVLSSYLLRLMAISGWAPSFGDCARCGTPGLHEFFNPALGGALCAKCCPPATGRLSEPLMRLLGALLSGQWEDTAHADEQLMRAANAVVNSYTQWHIEQRLKSLPLLELA